MAIDGSLTGINVEKQRAQHAQTNPDAKNPETLFSCNKTNRQFYSQTGME